MTKREAKRIATKLAGEWIWHSTDAGAVSAFYLDMIADDVELVEDCLREISMELKIRVNKRKPQHTPD